MWRTISKKEWNWLPRRGKYHKLSLPLEPRHNLLELLQAELKDEENFSLKTIIPFGNIVNNMT
jgi:hypothetical protein